MFAIQQVVIFSWKEKPFCERVLANIYLTINLFVLSMLAFQWAARRKVWPLTKIGLAGTTKEKRNIYV